MDDKAVGRLVAKKWAIAKKVGAKEERERQAADANRKILEELIADRKRGRSRHSRQNRRKKWYQKVIIVTVAASVVVLKAIEVLVMNFISRP